MHVLTVDNLLTVGRHVCTCITVALFYLYTYCAKSEFAYIVNFLMYAQYVNLPTYICMHMATLLDSEDVKLVCAFSGVLLNLMAVQL